MKKKTILIIYNENEPFLENLSWILGNFTLKISYFLEYLPFYGNISMEIGTL
jgi:hypothetical protein